MVRLRLLSRESASLALHLASLPPGNVSALLTANAGKVRHWENGTGYLTLLGNPFLQSSQEPWKPTCSNALPATISSMIRSLIKRASDNEALITTYYS